MLRLFKRNFGAFLEITKLLARHRSLVREMSRREILDRYSGQLFGWIWAIGHPLFLMGIYVFIFAHVFKLRVGGTAEMPLDYTAYILSGLIPWLAVQETLAKSCTAVTSQSSLVKQIIFPLEVLPAKGVLAALVSQGVSFAFLIAYVLYTHGGLPWTYAVLPLLFVLQIMAMLGVAMLFSAIGTFVRDLKDFVQLYCVAGVYMMPVVYLPDWVPEVFQPLLYINPFSYLIWCYQDVLYFGRFAHPEAWVVLVVLALCWYVFGYRLFRRLKPHFGNVV